MLYSCMHYVIFRIIVLYFVAVLSSQATFVGGNKRGSTFKMQTLLSLLPVYDRTA
jgi:prophage maintenance system killer protein